MDRSPLPGEGGRGGHGRPFPLQPALLLFLLFLSFHPSPATATASPSKKYLSCSLEGSGHVIQRESLAILNKFRAAGEDIEQARRLVASMIVAGLQSSSFKTRTDLTDVRPAGSPDPPGSHGLFDTSPTRPVELFVGYRAVANTHGLFTGGRSMDTDLAIVQAAAAVVYPPLVDRRRTRAEQYTSGVVDSTLADSDVSFYVAAWMGTSGEVWGYYPGYPLVPPDWPTFGSASLWGQIHGAPDAIPGDYYGAGDPAGFVAPTLPAANPNRTLVWTSPYVDPVKMSDNMISIIAPLYIGNTYMAAMGADVTLLSLQPLLEAIRLTSSGFTFIADLTGHPIIMSQQVIDLLYGPGTPVSLTVGTTLDSVSADPALTNWAAILSKILAEASRGSQGVVSDVQVLFHPGEAKRPAHVFWQVWADVAEWVMLAAVPLDELEIATRVSVPPSLTYSLTKGDEGRQEVRVNNTGRLGVVITLKRADGDGSAAWLSFDSGQEGQKFTLAPGQDKAYSLTVRTGGLGSGTTTAALALLVEDDGYPDCFQEAVTSITITANVAGTSTSTWVILGASVAVMIVIGGGLVAWLLRNGEAVKVYLSLVAYQLLGQVTFLGLQLADIISDGFAFAYVFESALDYPALFAAYCAFFGLSAFLSLVNLGLKVVWLVGVCRAAVHVRTRVAAAPTLGHHHRKLGAGEEGDGAQAGQSKDRGRLEVMVGGGASGELTSGSDGQHGQADLLSPSGRSDAPLLQLASTQTLVQPAAAQGAGTEGGDQRDGGLRVRRVGSGTARSQGQGEEDALGSGSFSPTSTVVPYNGGSAYLSRQASDGSAAGAAGAGQPQGATAAAAAAAAATGVSIAASPGHSSLDPHLARSGSFLRLRRSGADGNRGSGRGWGSAGEPLDEEDEAALDAAIMTHASVRTLDLLSNVLIACEDVPLLILNILFVLTPAASGTGGGTSSGSSSGSSGGTSGLAAFLVSIMVSCLMIGYKAKQMLTGCLAPKDREQLKGGGGAEQESEESKRSLHLGHSSLSPVQEGSSDGDVRKSPHPHQRHDNHVSSPSGGARGGGGYYSSSVKSITEGEGTSVGVGVTHRRSSNQAANGRRASASATSLPAQLIGSALGTSHQTARLMERLSAGEALASTRSFGLGPLSMSMGMGMGSSAMTSAPSRAALSTAASRHGMASEHRGSQASPKGGVQGEDGQHALAAASGIIHHADSRRAST